MHWLIDKNLLENKFQAACNRAREGTPPSAEGDARRVLGCLTQIGGVRGQVATEFTFICVADRCVAVGTLAAEGDDAGHAAAGILFLAV